MSAARPIGAFSPLYSRIWRNPAHSRLPQFWRLDGSEKECNRVDTRALPQVICVFVYHFRTPSPGGQQISQDVVLPAFFSSCHRCVSRIARVFAMAVGQRKRAVKRFTRRSGAQSGMFSKERLKAKDVFPTARRSTERTSKCISKLSPLPPPFVLDWPRAETRLVNKPSSAVLSAAWGRLFWAAMPLLARPSAQVRMCCTATRIPATANPIFTRRSGAIRSHGECRLAFGQGGVLRFKTQKSEAPCSRNC